MVNLADLFNAGSCLLSILTNPFEILIKLSRSTTLLRSRFCLKLTNPSTCVGCRPPDETDFPRVTFATSLKLAVALKFVVKLLSNVLATGLSATVKFHVFAAVTLLKSFTLTFTTKFPVVPFAVKFAFLLSLASTLNKLLNELLLLLLLLSLASHVYTKLSFKSTSTAVILNICRPSSLIFGSSNIG